MGRGRAWIATLSVLAAWPLGARAEDSGFHLAVQAGTNFPVDVGGGLGMELPGRLQLSGEVGVMPGAYVDAANSALVEAQVYDTNTAALVREALRNTLIWRAHLGWRPFARHGFFVQGGYGYGQLGGQLSVGQVATATGLSAPAALGAQSVDIQSELHVVDAELGWRWLIEDHLVVRAALGGLHTFASQSTLSVDQGGPVDLLAAPLERAGAAVLDDRLQRYGNTVELTLGVGYQAF